MYININVLYIQVEINLNHVQSNMYIGIHICASQIMITRLIEHQNAKICLPVRILYFM